MKTIEQMKSDYKSATGYDMPIYTYNGKLGVLYDIAGVPEFIQMDEFLLRPSVNYDDVCWVNSYSDCIGRNRSNRKRMLKYGNL